ncbi:MAG TPA: ATPase domain-containing protein, partial [Methanoregulaceae archaeon]|nr:ATPase domain-containing protein [Methanoregulaceae archaeon]
GIPLDTFVAGGSLRFHAVRPTAFSLEMHLAMMLKLIQEFSPEVVIVDPVSNLFPVGDDIQVRSMLMRLIDYIKMNQITGLFTNLSTISSQEAYSIEPTQSHVSSLMDAWISLKNVEGNGERNRVLSIVKARGLPHSNQLREFVMSDAGIDLLDVYTGSGAVLFGSARVAQANRDRVEQLLRDRELSRKIRALEQKREEMEREIEAIRERFSAEEEDLDSLISEHRLQEKETLADGRGMGAMRGVEE